MAEESFLQLDALPDPSRWTAAGQSFTDAQGRLYKELRFSRTDGALWVVMMFQAIECATDLALLRTQMETYDGAPMLTRVDFRNPLSEGEVRTSRGAVPSLISDIAGINQHGRETIVYSVFASRGEETFRVELIGESALLETVADECAAAIDGAIFTAR